MSAAEVLAHGVGGRQDLPIPFSFALLGAAAAVAVSFVAVATLRRTSRLRGTAAGRPIPAMLQAVADSAALRSALRVLGLAVTMFVATIAMLGADGPDNPTAGFVYVVFWVGLVPASLLFGPVWRLLNPLRTVHRALSAVAGVRPERGLWNYPGWLGYWPAAAGLFAFVWLELVAPGRTEPTAVLVWFAAYAAVHLLGSSLFGSGWFDRADAFEVYSALIGRLALLGRRGDGRLVLRNPMDGLDGLRSAPGLVATVCVLLGSTAFDGFSNAPLWIDAVQSSPSPTLVGTLGLIGAVLLVAAVFTAGIAVAARTGAGRQPASAFAHSVVPIAVGYLVAHYFSLFLFEGQRTIILASDPLDSGSNLLGLAERQVNFSLATPTTIATVQVLAVVAAHDRAVRLMPGRNAALGQIPLLVLMILYTVGGLTLLFAA
ncbi:MAG: hypothetical protein ACRDVZ_03840 [Jiangellaceae bacterium]